MILTDMTDTRLQDLYNEYWGLMQAAQITLHDSMREWDDDMAARCREQIKTYRAMADEVAAEMERRRNGEQRRPAGAAERSA